mmetsp:Transcript_16697/g.35408  ORF Transcript_16697/g.35408 Transcript_16697/m.35408 type:complete len:613 (-) Transcript_16697:116-1954(-)
MVLEGSEPELDGCWGAGGFVAGATVKGKYPRLTAAERTQKRASFRSLILKRYHSIVRAWRDFDRNGDGKLSYQEFLRALQKLGYYEGGPRKLFEAMDEDRSGFVSLHEVDPETTALLSSLAINIWNTCRTVDKAWTEVIGRRGATRVPREEFVRRCEELGFAGDAHRCFEELSSDKASSGISLQELKFLDLWFDKRTFVRPPPLHEKCELELQARLGDPKMLPQLKGPPKGKEPPRPKQVFKDLLLKSYGDFCRAWREGLDIDHNGQLDYKEFRKACHDVGYAGLPQDLWNDLDMNVDGKVSLWEIDKDTAGVLEAIHACAVEKCGSWKAAWSEVFDTRKDDRVELKAFEDACEALGYAGDAEFLFHLLDTDRTRYLTLATTAWISGVEAPKIGDTSEDYGDFRISGDFKRLTRSQTRRMDFHSRDHRLRLARFAARDRGEVPGSSPMAMTASSFFGASASSASLRSVATAPALSSSGSARSPPRSSMQLSRSSPSPAAPPPVGMVYKRPNCMEEPSIPDWLGDAEKRAASPLGASIRSLGSSKSAMRLDLSRPLSPQAPGRGGWSASRARLVDPHWGGVPAPVVSAKHAALLSRAVISEPSLARWREQASA